MSNKWNAIKTKNDLPRESGRYFVTDKYDCVFIEHLFLKIKIGFTSPTHWIQNYLAWMEIELPKPYKEKS